MKDTVIQIRNLSKSFGDMDVLKNVNLDLYSGENLVVLGKSGSGKSVLIKIMVGLLKQDSGSAIVSQLNQKKLNELRLKIGFSFQASALYDSMTVRENLEFPLVRNVKNLSKTDKDKLVEEVLEGVGLIQAINQMPSELLGIARTLILKPDIMLYDEPTAGLDPITCMDINNLINQVNEEYKTTSIIITHDLTCAKVTGDRMAVLLDGHFGNTGKFEEVFEHAVDGRVKSFYDYNFIEQ